jgi:hypothetical protein
MPALVKRVQTAAELLVEPGKLDRTINNYRFL